MAANKKVVVAGSSVTAGQLKDFFRQVDDGGITYETLQAFLEHQNPFGENITVAPVATNDLLDLDWSKVYEVLGMSGEFVEFAKANEAKLTPRPGLWAVPVLEGVTLNAVMAAFRKLEVETYQYVEDLDKDVLVNDRDPNRDGSYTVLFRKTVEADPDQKHRSHSVKCVTFLERLLLGLAYFLTTGKHLDLKSITLCADSRLTYGFTPIVYWNNDDGELSVQGFNAHHSPGFVRLRAVVS